MSDDTEQLTAAVARGERASVAAFYERYFDLLLRCAKAATRRDESFCLDIVHDAVLRVMRLIRPVTGGEGQLVAWLELVVRSVAYDHLRRAQRRAARERKAAGSPSSCEADQAAESADERALAAERVAWLRRELDRLDPALVELIERRYADDWTLTALARRLGVSTGTIDGRLRRALKHLRGRAPEAFDEA